MSDVNTSTYSSDLFFHLWSPLWQLVLFLIIHSLPPCNRIVYLQPLPRADSVFLGRSIFSHTTDTGLCHGHILAKEMWAEVTVHSPEQKLLYKPELVSPALLLFLLSTLRRSNHTWVFSFYLGPGVQVRNNWIKYFLKCITVGKALKSRNNKKLWVSLPVSAEVSICTEGICWSLAI